MTSQIVETSLIDLLENNVESVLINITKNLINQISVLTNANDAALISVWNELIEKDDVLQLKLKQPKKKKIIIFDD